MSCGNGAFVAINPHSSFTTDTAGILETAICLTLIHGVILKTNANLFKLCHDSTFFQNSNTLD